MSDATQAPPAAPPEKPKRTRRQPGANEVVPPPADVATLTLGEAAYLLRVSTTTVRRLVDEGELPSIEIGKRVLVSRQAVEQFLRGAEASKAPTSEAAAIKAAEEKARAEQRLRARVVADWNTGKDTFGLDQPPRERRRKPAAQG